MNTFGKIFKVNIFGESHSDNVGIIIDNAKTNMPLCIDDFEDDLKRRQGGKLHTTSRIETDIPQLKTGIFNGKTTGAPILIMFENKNINSKDYSNLINHPRPSHADLTFRQKYINNDYRGGGHSSGRLSVGIVAAGVVAKKMMPFKFETKILQIGNVTDENTFEGYLEEVSKQGDSVGAIVEITIKNVNNTLGEPFFYSVESALSQMLFSIGSVKGVSFGAGFDGVNLKGSQFNDLIVNKDGMTSTNNNGGINGGISNGNDIVIKVFIKPTASIKIPQETFNFDTNKIELLKIEGRHDPCIAMRAKVVLENACAIALCDLYLLSEVNK